MIIKKNETKKINRTCRQCGIDISHRSSKVEFCCSYCKAMWKEKQQYQTTPIVPKKNKPLSEVDRIEEFNKKYGRN